LSTIIFIICCPVADALVNIYFENYKGIDFSVEKEFFIKNVF